MLQVRYWDPDLTFGNNPVFPFTDAASGWGLTLRLDARQSPLSRLGAEIMYRPPSRWYVTGEAAFAPSWSASGMGLGLEAGWRSFTARMPVLGPACSNCSWEFTGVTAALTFRR